MKTSIAHVLRWLLILTAIIIPAVRFYHGYTHFYLNPNMDVGGDGSGVLQDVIIATAFTLPASVALIALGIGLPKWLGVESSAQLPLSKRLVPLWIVLGGAAGTIFLVGLYSIFLL